MVHGQIWTLLSCICTAVISTVNSVSLHPWDPSEVRKVNCPQWWVGAVILLPSTHSWALRRSNSLGRFSRTHFFSSGNVFTPTWTEISGFWPVTSSLDCISWPKSFVLTLWWNCLLGFGYGFHSWALSPGPSSLLFSTDLKIGLSILSVQCRLLEFQCSGLPFVWEKNLDRTLLNALFCPNTTIRII